LPSEQQANAEYANRLKERMRKVRPQTVTRHGEKKAFVFKELKTAPYVFLRHDAGGASLQPQFDGPFKVVKRGEKNYIIKVANRHVTVSIDRLQPAFVVPDDLEEKIAEPRNIPVPVGQSNARDENGASNNEPRKKAPATGMLRDLDEEFVFPTGIRPVSNNKKKERKLLDTGRIAILI
jgi:hypothetical protein